MRNLDIADTRAKLELYQAQGQIDSSTFGLVRDMKSGQSNAITSSNPNDDSDAGLNRAAFDSGTD
jgi:argininosuccinate synthase